ncbi:MAG: hypothetical protein ACOYNL_03890 [Rickettsiales bacterium]
MQIILHALGVQDAGEAHDKASAHLFCSGVPDSGNTLVNYNPKSAAELIAVIRSAVEPLAQKVVTARGNGRG